MLLKSYLLRQYFYIFSVVSSAMLFIFGVLQVSEILQDFMSGWVPVDRVFYLLLSHVPFLIMILIPMSVLVSGILLINKFEEKGEMTGIISLGCSYSRLQFWFGQLIFLIFIFMVAIIVFIEPTVLEFGGDFSKNMNESNLIKSFQAGKFSSSPDGNGVLYFESNDESNNNYKNIFIARKNTDMHKNAPKWEILTANNLKVDKGSDVLQKWHLKNATYYKFKPGYRQGEIDELEKLEIGFREKVNLTEQGLNFENMGVFELWSHLDKAGAMAYLHFKISTVIGILIMGLLIFPISSQTFFDTIFYKVFLAITLYSVYVALVITSKSYISKGLLSLTSGIMMPQIVFLLALAIYKICYKFLR
ncbi:MAG: LptF/LptG family permease [Pseudomonadota bacterium]|nr:LptF/LptG family permease [Pseudomonadota bacterium]